MRKRKICFTLCLVMLMTLLPISVSAQETGLCEHHPEHTSECGYKPPDPGSPCNHVHTDDCYKAVCIHQCAEDCMTDVTVCVHIHDESCYADGVLPAEGEEKPADACTHVCSTETGCVTQQNNCQHICDESCREIFCQHTHDESCGYRSATDGSPCTFVCSQCIELYSDDIVSVEISWGSMNFTFYDTADTEKGIAEGWNCGNGENKVTVTNKGNVDVAATVAYQPERTDIVGSFGEGVETTNVAVPVSSSKEWSLILANKPSEALDNATLGTVTITITQKEGE